MPYMKQKKVQILSDSILALINSSTWASKMQTSSFLNTLKGKLVMNFECSPVSVMSQIQFQELLAVESGDLEIEGSVTKSEVSLHDEPAIGAMIRQEIVLE